MILKHLAIIMDGNRRWARAHGLPILEGHRRVADKILEPLIEHAARLGIKYITFWAWSTENWQRSQQEVAGIMRLFRHLARKRLSRLHQKGVRVMTIGDISKFEPAIKEALEKAVEQTKNNQTITAIFALNYGGRDEIIRAINKWHAKLKSQSSNPPAGRAGLKISEEELSKYLDTAGVPDPELIVRTGGEERLSGFLLWQSEYSELYFPRWFMPEFTPKRLDEALEEYARRQRRFGK